MSSSSSNPSSSSSSSSRSQFYPIHLDAELCTPDGLLSKELHHISFDYSHKPDPSTSSLKRSLYSSSKSIKDSTWTLEYENGSGTSSNNNQSLTFTGQQTMQIHHTQPMDLVLIWDSAKNAYILTTIGSNLLLEPTSSRSQVNIKSREEGTSNSKDGRKVKGDNTGNLDQISTSSSKDQLSKHSKSLLSRSQSLKRPLDSSKQILYQSLAGKTQQKSEISSNRNVSFETNPTLTDSTSTQSNRKQDQDQKRRNKSNDSNNSRINYEVEEFGSSTLSSTTSSSSNLTSADKKSLSNSQESELEGLPNSTASKSQSSSSLNPGSILRSIWSFGSKGKGKEKEKERDGDEEEKEEGEFQSQDQDSVIQNYKDKAFMDIDSDSVNEPRRGRTSSRVGHDEGSKESVSRELKSSNSSPNQKQHQSQHHQSSNSSPNQKQHQSQHHQSSNYISSNSDISSYSVDISSVALHLRDKQKARLGLTGNSNQGNSVSSTNSSLERNLEFITPSASPAPQTEALTPLLNLSIPISGGDRSRLSTLEDDEMNLNEKDGRNLNEEEVGIGLGLNLEIESDKNQNEEVSSSSSSSSSSSPKDIQGKERNIPNNPSLSTEMKRKEKENLEDTSLLSLPGTPTPNHTNLSTSSSSLNSAAEWQPPPVQKNLSTIGTRDHHLNHETSFVDDFDDGSDEEDEDDEDEDEDEDEEEDGEGEEDNEIEDGANEMEDNSSLGIGMDIDEDDLLEDFAAELEDSLMNQQPDTPVQSGFNEEEAEIEKSEVPKKRGRGRPKGKGKK